MTGFVSKTLYGSDCAKSINGRKTKSRRENRGGHAEILHEVVLARERFVIFVIFGVFVVKRKRRALRSERTPHDYGAARARAGEFG